MQRKCVLIKNDFLQHAIKKSTISFYFVGKNCFSLSIKNIPDPIPQPDIPHTPDPDGPDVPKPER